MKKKIKFLLLFILCFGKQNLCLSSPDLNPVKEIKVVKNIAIYGGKKNVQIEIIREDREAIDFMTIGEVKELISKQIDHAAELIELIIQARLIKNSLTIKESGFLTKKSVLIRLNAKPKLRIKSTKRRHELEQE